MSEGVEVVEIIRTKDDRYAIVYINRRYETPLIYDKSSSFVMRKGDIK
jgi:hypothetical protein